jgi:hypothetical protein
MTALTASKPRPALRHHATSACKHRANYLNPKEIRGRALARRAFDLRRRGNYLKLKTMV